MLQPLSFHRIFATILSLALCAGIVSAREKKSKEDAGLGFTAEVTASKSELTEAVQDVINNGIIQGSKEYDKDPYVTGANSAASSPLFSKWTGAGDVYFKVRTDVIAPRNFVDSGDQGTLAVRYIVQPKDATRSILRIDAVYVENERHTVHPSNGTVETSEFHDIQDRVEAIRLQKKQAIEGEKNRQQEIARRALEQHEQMDADNLAASTSTQQGLEEKVHGLRQQLERVVKGPGVQLKTAPYRSAANLKVLSPGTQIVIVVVTPYWFGVETEDGLHGWLHHDQLEMLP